MQFHYKATARVSEAALLSSSAYLAMYRKNLTDVLSKRKTGIGESAITLPFDHELLAEVKAMVASKVAPKLRYIILVGIGGSNLGTRAVYDALFGAMDILAPKRFPKILFIDTCDSETLAVLRQLLAHEVMSADEVLINVISKSGETVETITNFSLIREIFLKKFRHGDERIVVTTLPSSALATLATREGIATLTMPDWLSGRFSVFSAVGLFPLLAAGIDIEALRRGARYTTERHLISANLDHGPLVSATVLYHHYRQGKNIHDTFLFHLELESLGKWYRQLLGESIGKETTHRERVGLTPTVSIGSTDLHSIGQLSLGGPKDKITTFVSANTAMKIDIPDNEISALVSGGSKGLSMGELMAAIYEGTRIAYKKEGLPFMEINLPAINTEELGAFL